MTTISPPMYGVIRPRNPMFFSYTGWSSFGLRFEPRRAAPRGAGFAVVSFLTSPVTATAAVSW